MKDKLLSMLKNNAGVFVSGEELSRKLNVTRTAVWKHIRSLREKGYEIESSPGRGYKLVAVPDLLLPAEIQDGLVTAVLGKRIYHFAEVDSTNRVARQLAQNGEPEGSVVLAEVQAGGRGRLGREWISPAGGIWLSLLLRPNLAPFQAQLLTLAAAVAAVEATEEACGIRPGIKWPNDLLLGERKLAGILTEVSAEMERVNFLVLGIGVNANIRAVSFPGEVGKTAVSLLEELGSPVDRAAWVKKFIVYMEMYYLEALSAGFGRVLELWRRYSVTLEREVSVHTAGRTVTGTAVDIDDSGALLVRTAMGEEKFLAGEVTLRPAKAGGE
ncbi:MAG: biotin--[acetyl-CoA-carboxylase] ligase [Dethiobacter sp.]|jgi:BirA family biotin operon repressor/biotin-[acetyl-CoA-carboxylase] ligase|nr:biotin--[acetyl-CoA-carboxylase] ligase [Dethiobacter sp.]